MQTSQVACHVPPGGPSGATATAGRCDGTRLHEGKRLHARNGSAVNNARSGVLELRSLRPTRCAGFSPMQDQREGLKDIARCGHTVETYRGAQAAPGRGCCARHIGIDINATYVGDGAAVYQHACALDREGIASKRLGSPYRAGRSSHCFRPV